MVLAVVRPGIGPGPVRGCGVTIPAEGVGKGLAAIVAAVAGAAERDADDRAAALGRRIERLVVLRRIAQRRTDRMRERERPGVGRVDYWLPGTGRIVRLSADDIDAVLVGLRARRAEWLERAE